MYSLYLASLILFNLALAYHSHQKNANDNPKDRGLALLNTDDDEEKRFKIRYFSVYGLVVAADWLQGPYIYVLYKDEKNLEEAVVAMLFATAFVSAGVTASFVGMLADRHGRKAACFACCVSSAISCLSVLSDDLMVLFLGRFFGGLSSTLIYTVFETWMISDYHSRGLGHSFDLGKMFGLSVTLSGVIAILAGVIGEGLVDMTGTKTSPFLLAVMCLVCAAAIMTQNWDENLGESQTEKSGFFEGLSVSIFDKRVLTLGLATTLFEGSMFLFVFFWSPALSSARRAADTTEPPPYGTIFSSFMCAMMLGSLLFSSFEMTTERETGRTLLNILALASSALMVPVLSKSESATFWSFAVFEVCVGMYFPTMSRLKSTMIDDATRGKIYTLMRMPLNLFIAIALGVTQEGDTYRNKIFTATGTLLLGAFFAVERFLF